MSERKRTRDSESEDRREHKKHKTSKNELEKLKKQTKKLNQEVQKLKHIETLWVTLEMTLMEKANYSYALNKTKNIFSFFCSYEKPPPGFIKVPFINIYETILLFGIFHKFPPLLVTVYVYRSMRKNQRTVFLLILEMKMPGTFWQTRPPRGSGCLWGRRWRWCSVSAFPQLFSPEFILIRTIMCPKHGVYVSKSDHSSTGTKVHRINKIKIQSTSVLDWTTANILSSQYQSVCTIFSQRTVQNATFLAYYIPRGEFTYYILIIYLLESHNSKCPKLTQMMVPYMLEVTKCWKHSDDRKKTEIGKGGIIIAISNNDISIT